MWRSKDLLSIFYGLLLITLFSSSFTKAQGFKEGTLVLTPNGTIAIEHISKNDKIISYDFNKKTIVEDKVIYIQKKSAEKYCILKVNDTYINCGTTQKFYTNAGWIQAMHLQNLDQLKGIDNNSLQIIAIIDVNEQTELYEIEIERNHNFFVSKDGILVHNFVFLAPLATYLATNFTISIGFVVGSLGLKYVINKNNRHRENQNGSFINTIFDGNQFQSNSLLESVEPIVNAKNHNAQRKFNAANQQHAIAGGNKDPRDDEDKKDQKTFRPITNKEAEEAAKKLGFEKTKYISKDGMAIFRKGNKYISADRTRHNGGFWKMANSVEELLSKSTRLGTYDISLNRIGD